jgi:hypothetical protein
MKTCVIPPNDWRLHESTNLSGGLSACGRIAATGSRSSFVVAEPDANGTGPALPIDASIAAKSSDKQVSPHFESMGSLRRQPKA